MKIYQVEISNYCNLKCTYCPHSIQTRKKGFMTLETFNKVLMLAKKCQQKMIYLHNFGEPLLHPKLELFIQTAKEKEIECSFYTNGVMLDSKRIDSLYTAGLRRISISNHIRGASEKALEEIRKSNSNLCIEEIYEPTFIHNWCGQIRYDGCTHICVADSSPCIFEKQNAFVVLWNGDIASCCLDCNGISSSLTIDDLLQEDYIFKKCKLCLNCDLMRGEEQL